MANYGLLAFASSHEFASAAEITWLAEIEVASCVGKPIVARFPAADHQSIFRHHRRTGQATAGFL